jgi:hypothetical protein
LRRLESLLREIARELEPSAASKAAAARSQQYLRRQLYTGQMQGRLVHDYLSGSYARRTAIHPLGDVDIIFLIDPSTWPKAFFGFADKPKPSDVLQSFAGALRYSYERSSAFTQRRSIRLELNHLHIDCVPAIAIEGGPFIWVGDRKDDEWIKSSPKLHEIAVTAANKANRSLLKPLIKILKCWNRNLPSTAGMRSFVIETMAVTLFSRVRFASLDQGLFYFFDFIAGFDDAASLKWSSTYGIQIDRWNGMNVPDLAGTNRNIAGGVDNARLVKFRDHAIATRNRLLNARSAKTESAAKSYILSALGMPRYV